MIQTPKRATSFAETLGKSLRVVQGVMNVKRHTGEGRSQLKRATVEVGSVRRLYGHVTSDGRNLASCVDQKDPSP